jgi:hypothetical protein
MASKPNIFFFSISKEDFSKGRKGELIDQDTKWWNSNLITEVFHEEEARVICQIPLSPTQQKDLLILRCMSNDDFLVRSVNHMENELQSLQRSGGFRQRDGDTVWKAIWNFKILNAVKMFMWRACNNLLPMKMNLLPRGVVHDVQCAIFGRDEEMVKHILWSCPSTQDIWGCDPKKLQKGFGDGLTFSQVVEEVLRRCELVDVKLMAMVA